MAEDINKGTCVILGETADIIDLVCDKFDETWENMYEDGLYNKADKFPLEFEFCVLTKQEAQSGKIDDWERLNTPLKDQTKASNDRDNAAAASQGGSASGKPKTDNFKTTLCYNYQNGWCRFGDRCHFAHGRGDMY